MSVPGADAAAALEKSRLRAEKLALRKDVSAYEREALAAVLLQKGLTLATSRNAQVVSLYWPIRGEPDVLPLLALLARSGFATALPVTGARGQPLAFRAWRPGDPQSAGPMRIPEPAPHLPEVEPDLLFVPLAAWDRRGNRIGYGAGYYDRTLERLRAMKPITAVGISYLCQEAISVPAGPHDQRLDFVLNMHDLWPCRAA